MLPAARTVAPDGVVLTWASYDTGQAAAHLTTQAQAEGLVVHQMGGFDPDAVRSTFDLPPAEILLSAAPAQDVRRSA